jgi:hypothetical protein
MDVGVYLGLEGVDLGLDLVGEDRGLVNKIQLCAVQMSASFDRA